MLPGLQNAVPWSEFSARRQKIASKMGEGTLVLQGAGPVRAFNGFVQTAEFLYLTGVEVPQAYFTLEATGRSVLYLPDQDETRPLGDRPIGPCDRDALCELTGISDVKSWSQLPKDIAGLKDIWVTFAPSETELSARDVLQYCDRLGSQEPLGAIASRDRQFLAHVASRAPLAQLHNLTPILDEARMIKSQAELKLMREAGRLSALAVRRAMLASHVGVGENELEGIAWSTFLSEGARGVGYKTILPAGKRIWDAHYTANNNKAEEGDFLLMDCAPDVERYTSDIGRMWPVNGKFAPWQLELYGFVALLHEETLKRIRPGRLPYDIVEEVGAALLPVWESTKWSRPSFAEATKALLSFKGTFSHPVGLSVHDVGHYYTRPLEPGMVFAVDPQLWVRGERLYVRVEDTVAVTENGVEVLTEGPPRIPEDIEAFLAQR